MTVEDIKEYIQNREMQLYRENKLFQGTRCEAKGYIELINEIYKMLNELELETYKNKITKDYSTSIIKVPVKDYSYKGRIRKFFKRLKRSLSLKDNININRPKTRYGTVVNNNLTILPYPYSRRIYCISTGETKDGRKLWTEVDYKTLEFRNPDIQYLLVYGHSKKWTDMRVLDSNIFIPYKKEVKV